MQMSDRKCRLAIFSVAYILPSFIQQGDGCMDERKQRAFANAMQLITQMENVSTILMGVRFSLLV